LTAASVLALGLGIGATTTMFGIVRGGTRSLPLVAGADEIVAVMATVAGTGGDALLVQADYRQLKESLTQFDGLGAFRMESVNAGSDSGPAERLEAASVTTNTFDLLGVAPERGRAFGLVDGLSGAPPVMLISHELWRSRFNLDPAAVGSVVRIDGGPRTIVGVMPAGFGFPVRSKVWLPLEVDAVTPPTAASALQMFGRLAHGASLDRASREMAAAVGRLSPPFPQSPDARTASVVPFLEIETPREVLLGLRLLVGIVSLVLLVACANVANLLLARAAARSRDFAIRTALGGSRARLLIAQLTESALVAMLAAMLGIGLASVGLRFFASASANVLDAFWMDFRVDPVVAGFAGLLGFVAAAASGLIPALRATARGVIGVLANEAASTSGLRVGRLGRGLVAAQIALACGALVLTTTFVMAAASLRAVEIPFPVDRVLTAQLAAGGDVLQSNESRARLLANLRDRLMATPEISRAAFVSVFPGRGAGGWPVAFEDTAANAASGVPRTSMMAVTPEFFDLAAASARRGRLLTWQDDGRAPFVAVVNESFVARHSPTRDPLGRRLRLGTREFTIVGVVPDLLMQDIEETDGAGFYVSMLQYPPFAIRVLAETAGPALDAAPALRQAVAAVDRDLPVIEVATLREAIFADKRILDALATLFLVFGAGAIFLAGLSLHAVLSFVIAQRRRELGIRLALGASARDMAGLILRRGGMEVAWGLGLGLLAAFGLSRAIAATLERAPEAGPAALAAIAGVVAVGAALAAWRPLSRILRLDPVAALRQD